MAITYKWSVSGLGTETDDPNVSIDVGTPGNHRLIIVTIGVPAAYAHFSEYAEIVEVYVGGRRTKALPLPSFSNGTHGYSGNAQGGLFSFAIDEVGLGALSGQQDIVISDNKGAYVRVHAHLFYGVRNKDVSDYAYATEQHYNNDTRTLNPVSIYISTAVDDLLFSTHFYGAEGIPSYVSAWSVGTNDIPILLDTNTLLSCYEISTSTTDYANTSPSVTATYTNTGGDSFLESVVRGLVYNFKPYPSSFSSPEIHNVGIESYNDGDTNIPITGGGFGASQGTSKVYVGDSANYTDAGITLVEQTIDSWSDTEVQFTLSRGSITDHSVYVFVVLDPGGAGEDPSNGFLIEWVGYKRTKWLGPVSELETFESNDSWQVRTSDILLSYSEDLYSITDTDLLVGSQFYAYKHIPQGATLEGLEVQVRKGNINTNTDVVDKVLYFSKDGAQIGTDFADTVTDWPEVVANGWLPKTYGDPDSILGGTSITMADVIDETFSLNFQGTKTAGSPYVYVEALRIRAVYSGGNTTIVIDDGPSSIVDANSTDVSIRGRNFGDEQGTSILVLADSSTYATATKTTQSVTFWGPIYGLDREPREIRFDISLGNVPSGQCYLFVVKDPGGAGEEVSDPWPILVLPETPTSSTLYRFRWQGDADFDDWNYSGPGGTGYAYPAANGKWSWTNGKTASIDVGPFYGQERDSSEGYIFTESSSLYGEFTMEYGSSLDGAANWYLVEFYRSMRFNTEELKQLEFQVWDGTQWVTEKTYTGFYSDNTWKREEVYLGGYTNQDLKFRFRIVTTTYKTDLGLDTITIYSAARPVPPSRYLDQTYALRAHEPRYLDQTYSLDVTLERRLDQVYTLSTAFFRSLDQTYSLDAVLARYLDQQYSLDVTQVRHLNQAYSLDTSVQFAYLDQTYANFGGQILLDVLSRVNYERSLIGLEALARYQGNGEFVDTIHSNDMAATGVFSHDDPSFSVGYQTAQERIDKVELAKLGWAENLAYISYTVKDEDVLINADTVMDNWMNSPEHRDAILTEWDNRGYHPKRMMLGLSYRLEVNSSQEQNAYFNAIAEETNIYLYYRFHESSGPTVQDSTSANRDATYVETLTYQDTGPLNNNNSDTTYAVTTSYSGYVEQLNSTIINDLKSVSGDYAIECWFKPYETNDDAWIFTISDTSTTDGILFGVKYNGITDKLEVYWKTPTDGLNVQETTTTLGGANAWYYLYIDGGVGGTGTYPRCYINGSSVSWQTNTGTAVGKWFEDLPSSVDAMHFALYKTVTSNITTHISLSEVVIYISPLTEARIQDHYTSGTTAPPTVETYNHIVYYTQVFIDFGYLDSAIMNRYLHNTYSTDVAIIEYPNQVYELDAYTPVAIDDAALYSLVLAHQHETLWDSTIALQHVANITYSVAIQNEAVFYSMSDVDTQHETTFSLDQYEEVSTQHAASYATTLATRNESLYGLLQTIANQNSATYSLTVDVLTQHDTGFSLLAHDVVLSQHRSIWSMLDTTTDILVPDTTLTYNGDTLDIAEFVISCSEGDLLWVANVILTDLSHYVSIQRGEEFTISIEGEEYSFVVDSKSLNRSDIGSLSMRIDGVSKASRLKSPDASLIDVEYESNMTARDMIEDILGEAVDYRIVDWMIPGGTVSGTSTTPAALARTIAEAAGGLLESDKDGTLIVRNMFPVKIPDYDKATPDQVYTDVEDNLSVSEDYEARTDYNRFRITDGEGTIGDSFEWEQDDDDPTTGILRLYLVPWRDDVSVVYTGGGLTSITQLGAVTREVTEIVEFAGGEASTQYPVYGITSSSWHSGSLGPISYTEGSRDIVSGTDVHYGYGLVEITYNTKAMEYRLVGSSGIHTQFISVDSGQ